MSKLDVKLLEAISNTFTPSSYEAPLRDMYLDYFKDKADIVGKDILGNASVRKVGNQPGSRIIITAHMDEVGFVVSDVTEGGFIRVREVGAIDPALVPGTCVQINSFTGEPVFGIFGRRPIHDISYEDNDSVTISMPDMYIDIGASSKSEALKKVKWGDPIVWKSFFTSMSKDLFSMRAADNKIGVYSIFKSMEYFCKNSSFSGTIFGVLTSMEEVGEASSISAAVSKIDPAVVITIDTYDSRDCLDSTSEGGVPPVLLNSGPVIYYGPYINRKLSNFILETAEKNKIPHTPVFTETYTSTDMDIARNTSSGYATALIGIPIRYMHAPQSVFSAKSLNNTVKLIIKTCEGLNSVDSFIP